MSNFKYLENLENLELPTLNICYNSKTRFKRPLIKDKTKPLKTNDSLMKVESIAECFSWSILQYFWPALSDNRSWKPILVFFLSGCLRQVLLYLII